MKLWYRCQFSAAIFLLQSSWRAKSSTSILAISAARVSATVWKSGVEMGFLSALPNIILAFANNICMLCFACKCFCAKIHHLFRNNQLLRYLSCNYPNLRKSCLRPFRGQADRFKPRNRMVYDGLMASADVVILDGLLDGLVVRPGSKAALLDSRCQFGLESSMLLIQHGEQSFLK